MCGRSKARLQHVQDQLAALRKARLQHFGRSGCSTLEGQVATLWKIRLEGQVERSGCNTLEVQVGRSGRKVGLQHGEK